MGRAAAKEATIFIKKRQRVRTFLAEHALEQPIIRKESSLPSSEGCALFSEQEYQKERRSFIPSSGIYQSRFPSLSFFSFEKMRLFADLDQCAESVHGMLSLQRIL